MSGNIKHLYIHMPFCRRKCSYCDFYSVSNVSADKKKAYTDAVIKEIRHFSETLCQPLDTVYFGGGSPFMAGLDNLRHIIDVLSPYMDKNTEFSVELNPEHLEGNIEIFDLGFNRISLGVQTTDLDILKRINREYDADTLSKNIKVLKDKGIDLSLDFMFGLPGQDIKKLKNDIDFIKAKKPDHVSFYLFTIHKDHEMADACASDDLVEEMFMVTHDGLKAIGYDHYEVSNYALKGKECRHNMAYWERRSYLGVGAAAHSFIKEDKIRKWHPKDIDSYIKNPVSCEGQETLDDGMERDEKVMLGLRLLNAGVKKSLINEADYLPLIEKGVLRIKDNNILVTDKGITLLDYITSELGNS